jgi:hypothetical protein
MRQKILRSWLFCLSLVVALGLFAPLSVRATEAGNGERIWNRQRQ